MGATFARGCSENHRRALAIELLELLQGRDADNFDGMATGYQSQFHGHDEWGEMFAASREKVTHFIRTELRFKKL
jgi:hypothetical protein